MSMFCEKCGIDEPEQPLCRICSEAERQKDQKTLDALKRCREDGAVVELSNKDLEEVLRKTLGQLESLAHQAARAIGQTKLAIEVLKDCISKDN